MTEFQEAFAEYKRLKAIEDAFPPTNSDEDEEALHRQTVLTDAAIERLLGLPAMSSQDAALKLLAVHGSYDCPGCGVHRDRWDQIVGEIVRHAGLPATVL